MTREHEAPARLLVVDDEEAVNAVLEELLGGEGYAVTVVRTLAEGLAALERQPFDLVLADKNLPDGSGLELVRAARRGEDGPEAIMMTAYASLASAIEAMDLGARGYLLKPFEDVGEVLEKVQKVLTAAASRRRMRALIDELRRTNDEAAGRRQS